MDKKFKGVIQMDVRDSNTGFGAVAAGSFPHRRLKSPLPAEPTMGRKEGW